MHILKLRISILWNAKYSEENRLLVQAVKNYLIANKQAFFFYTILKNSY